MFSESLKIFFSFTYGIVNNQRLHGSVKQFSQTFLKKISSQNVVLESSWKDGTEMKDYIFVYAPQYVGVW